jgi:hypothetical protein
MSDSFRSIVRSDGDAAQDISAILTGVPGLFDWLKGAIAERSTSAFQGGNVIFQLLPLNSKTNTLQRGAEDEDAASYVLVASNNAMYPNGLTTEKVRRIQHDIKNQLGGLKLYTNFLKKRLAADTELCDVIDKMIGIVGTITQQVTLFRQGEEQ